MNRIAQMAAAERAELFAETADRKGLPETIGDRASEQSQQVQNSPVAVSATRMM